MSACPSLGGKRRLLLNGIAGSAWVPGFAGISSGPVPLSFVDRVGIRFRQIVKSRTGGDRGSSMQIWSADRTHSYEVGRQVVTSHKYACYVCTYILGAMGEQAKCYMLGRMSGKAGPASRLCRLCRQEIRRIVGQLISD